MSRLELHIINGGVGESIAVRLPEGSWGVVDCYAPSVKHPESNPTLAFLRERGVERLEFLCLTHPHDDHYRGIEQLLDHFPVACFWRFGPLTEQELKKYLLTALETSAREEDDEEEEESTDALARIFDKVTRLREQGATKLRRLHDRTEVIPLPYDEQAELRITSIAPSSGHAEDYEHALEACFDEKGRCVRTFQRQRHNEVSAALVIRYGATRIFLCGDVEAKAWREIIHPGTTKADALRATGVKISHHGSKTGNIKGLWEHFSAQGERKPVAVVTPYRRFSLPDRTTLRHIREHTAELLTTCRSATCGWEPDANEPPDSYDFQTFAVMHASLKRWQAPKNYQVGVCSLYFDREGGCTTDCTGAAHPVTWPL